jgi:tetratricopeptide (TPR) repeat protein
MLREPKMRHFARISVALLLWTLPASADGTEEAKQHFEHAKDLYQHGSYKEALVELKTARELDPNAKDLVYNLGVVSEKLGKIDDALKYFRTYIEMDDVTDTERARAETTIKRLEGAKRMQPRDDGHSSAPPPVDQTSSRGKFDGWTITAGVLGVGGLTLGAIFGIAALVGRPSSGFVTGKDGTFQDLKSKADDAHTMAIAADVSLIAGAAFTGLAAFLFFGRSNDIRRGSSKPSVTVTVLPTGVGGTF